MQRFLVQPERVLRAGLAPPSQLVGTAIDPATLQPLRVARREASDAFELAYLEALMTRSSGNMARAGAIAEVSRQMVQKMMRKHGLK